MNGDDSGSDASTQQTFERELLASAAGDDLSDERVRAAWSRFAVTLGATATLAGAATHDALASGVTSGGRGVVRWVSLGALGGGIVTAAVMTVFGSHGAPAGGVGADAAPVASVGSVAVSSAEAGPVANPLSEGTPKAAAPTQADPFVVEQAAGEPHAEGVAQKPRATRRAHEANARGPAARPDTSSSLAAEIALLDEARRAQSTGQSEHALAVLARYQREHPHGELRRESDVLKLETLSGRGDHEEAASLARHFLEAFPDDPHTARVRTFVH